MLDQFWVQLAAASRATLLLDYDGTLAPFRVERDRATPYAGVREKLSAIRRDTATRLIIISGRAIDDLLPLLALEPPPEIWGCHGWEKLAADGQRPVVELPAGAAEGLRQGAQLIAQAGLEQLCEIKPVSLAIHWRGLPDQQIAALREQVNAYWRPLTFGNPLEIHPFNGGLELRCPGRTKGTAIESILDQLAAGEPAAFLGDDLTDEDGFKAIKGRGLSILVNCEPRRTYADLLITPPAELLAFLDRWYKTAPRSSSQAERGMP